LLIHRRQLCPQATHLYQKEKERKGTQRAVHVHAHAMLCVLASEVFPRIASRRRSQNDRRLQTTSCRAVRRSSIPGCVRICRKKMHRTYAAQLTCYSKELGFRSWMWNGDDAANRLLELSVGADARACKAGDRFAEGKQGRGAAPNLTDLSAKVAGRQRPVRGSIFDQ